VEKSLLIGGFGGQGVQTLGKLLTYGVNETGAYVTFYPAYGGEMRGGTSNCTVIVSDEDIASPSKFLVDYVIALNKPSFDRFEPRVAPGGSLILNSSIIKDASKTKDVKTIGIPVNEISEKVGSAKVLNIVMLGFFVELSGLVPLDLMKQVVLERLGKKEEFIELNKRAFDAGVEYAKSLK
jgi:2-oxoglutarate ferredoxin oxidoreductase subunit gamma